MDMLSELAHEYAAEYEMRDPDYTPSENERVMIEDAILGFVDHIEAKGFVIVALAGQPAS